MDFAGVAATLFPGVERAGRVLRPPRKAFRALVAPRGAHPQDPAQALFAKLNGRLGDWPLVAYRAVDTGSMELVGSTGWNAPTLLKLAGADLADTWRPPGCVFLVDHFERLSVANQIAFFGAARAARERGLELFLCAAGAWSVARFREEWAEGAEQSCSPPLNDFMELGGSDLSEIERQFEGLGSAGVGGPSEAYEYAGALTRGDPEVLGVIANAARHQPALRLEQVIACAAECPEVREVIEERLRGTSARQKRMLASCIVNQRVMMSGRDADAEDLFLRGLMRRVTEGDGGERCYWEPFSPVVAAALMGEWTWTGDDSPALHDSTELFMPQHPSFRVAASQIADLENFLRNAVVLRAARRSRTTLGEQILAELPQRQREAAWHREGISSRELPRLLRDPRTGYLELSELKTLLASDLFQDLSPKRSAIEARLDEFAEVRRNVAHSRAVAPSVVAQIGAIRDFFEHLVADAAHTEFIAADFGSAKVEFVLHQVTRNGTSQECRIHGRLTNRSERPLAKARLELHLGVGDDCVHAVAAAPFTIGPGEEVPGVFACKSLVEAARVSAVRVLVVRW